MHVYVHSLHGQNKSSVQSSVLFITCPYHFNLPSGIFLDISPTFVVHLIPSFLILTSFVTPCIHLSIILISATSTYAVLSSLPLSQFTTLPVLIGLIHYYKSLCVLFELRSVSSVYLFMGQMWPVSSCVIVSPLCGIQVLRNAFFWKFDTHPPPRNSSNVELYIFVTLFSEKSATLPPPTALRKTEIPLYACDYDKYKHMFQQFCFSFTVDTLCIVFLLSVAIDCSR